MKLPLSHESISIAKALAIIFVVIGHSGAPLPITKFVYAFHVPFFFIISAYCFKDTYINNQKTFVIKRVRGLYWPYLKWGFCFLALHPLMYQLHVTNQIYTSSDYLRNAVFMLFTMTKEEPVLGAIWFLRALLFSALVFIALIGITKRIKSIIVMGCLLIITIFVYQFINISTIKLLFLGTCFYYAGYYLRDYHIRIGAKEIMLYFLIVVAGTVFIGTGMGDGLAPLLIIPYFFVAIAGSVMTIGLGQLLFISAPHFIKSFLIYTGNNTMIILVLHMVAFKIVSLFIISMHQLPIEHLAERPVIEGFTNYFLLYSIIGTLVPLAIKYTYDKVKLKHIGKNQK